MTSNAVQGGSSVPKTFDFTKRKRWADLLVTELAGVINLILSESCTVLYCSPAVTELTGWKDTDLIDRDFLELIATTDDQAMFRASFDESIQNNSDLHSFVRVKCIENPPSHSTTPRDMLFEIKGEPHITEADGAYLFATAKPYPSQHAEMLSTFLDLKMENDRLQRRRMELNARLPRRPIAGPSTTAPSQIYATSPIHGSSMAGALDASALYYPPTFSGLPGIDSLLGYDGTNGALLQTSSAEDENEEGSKRKKLKKGPLGEQHVCITCGRTDSPEWRKGPQGPKTLCNACGLRWAKQKRIEKNEGSVATVSGS